MILFLSLSAPLLWAFTAFSHWEREIAHEKLVWFRLFLRGLLAAIPGLLLLALAKEVAGFAWRPRILLFASVLAADHLLPVLLSVAAAVLFLRRISANQRGGALFLTGFSFLCGWATLAGIVDAVSSWGRGDPYVQILIPLLRIAEILAASLILGRFHPWEGRDCLLVFASAAAACLLAAAPSFVYDLARRGSAVAIALVLASSAVLFLISRYPRVFLVQGSDGLPPAGGRGASGKVPLVPAGSDGKAAPGAASAKATGISGAAGAGGSSASRRRPSPSSPRRRPPAGRTGPGRRV